MGGRRDECGRKQPASVHRSAGPTVWWRHPERGGWVEGNDFTGQAAFRLLACDPPFINQNIGPSVQAP